MSKKTSPTCDECYFRAAGLCALAGQTVCPTFREARRTLVPPQQPRLVPRALAQHAAS